MRPHRLELMACLFLILATLAVYWQVGNHEFINLDDNKYVTENRHIQAGLTLKGIKWALTATDITYWHPLTWLSLILDHDLYGLNPGGYHLTNLLLHIANTLLLFLTFKRMTGAHWRSAFVAALFALHPLNVESVAWVAERKNVLSTFFWMLTLWTYARYAERPSLNRYLLVLLPFALGLMAKPMLVTLPFVLILLDYWPLGRLQLNSLSTIWGERAGVRGVLWEKVPLLALSAISIYLSSLSVQRLGVVVSTESVPMGLRIANALVSYVCYIGKMIWPHNLAVYYPPPVVVPMWQAAGAALFLVFVSVLAIRASRQRPYLAVGWLWYVGTLVPVIGLVRAGLWPAMADRFAYVPFIGLFVIITWGVADLVTKWRYQRLMLATITGAVLLPLAICTWLQAGHWKNSIALFEHTLGATGDNYLAHYNMGGALGERGNLEESMSHYSKALRIKTRYAKGHGDLGVALAEQRRLEDAIDHYSEALRIKPHLREQIKPNLAKTHNNLGNTLARLGKFEDAMAHYSEALRIKPDYAEVHYNIGLLFGRMENYHGELHAYERAIRLKPNYAKAYSNLGVAYAQIGRYPKAVWAFKEALRLNPDDRAAQQNLKMAYDKIKNGKNNFGE